MQAAFITAYGPLENIQVGEQPKPNPFKGEVLVRMRAASVNPIDYKQVLGELKPLVKPAFPLLLGSDGAGVVEALGEGVEGFETGDEVYFRTPLMATGSIAEYISLPASLLALKPANMSFAEAASIPLVGLTAVQALEKAGLKAGARVLIHAGAGGVGSFAIQYAKAMGAYVATTASQKRFDMLKALGADEIVDYRNARIEDQLKDMDIVLDTLGPTVRDASYKTLKKGGTLVSIQGMPDPETVARMGVNPIIRMVARLSQWKHRRVATKYGAVFQYHWMRESGAELAKISALIKAGEIKAVIDSQFSLEDTPAAFARSASGRAGGKIVVMIEGGS